MCVKSVRDGTRQPIVILTGTHTSGPHRHAHNRCVRRTHKMWKYTALCVLLHFKTSHNNHVA